MTKTRIQHLYQLTGTITARILKKASPQSKYAGNLFYSLTANLENQKKTIQVFKDKLTNPQIWEIIEKKQYLRRKYRFLCHNVRGFYHLVDWEELNE